MQGPLPPDVSAELQPSWEALRQALRHAKETGDYGPGLLRRATADFSKAAERRGVTPEAVLVLLKRAAFEEGLEGFSDRWRELLIGRLVRWGIESYFAKVGPDRTIAPDPPPIPASFADELVCALHAHIMSGSRSIGSLAAAVRELAQYARGVGVPIEQLIVLLKALCDHLLAATPVTRSGRERTRSRERVIFLLIQGYFA